MLCQRCLVHKSRLVQIYTNCNYQVSMNGGKISNVQEHLLVEVCDCCLVGEHVPAFRTSSQCWSIGTVVSFSENTNQFQLKFGLIGDDTEFVELDSQPYSAYVTQWRSRINAQSSKFNLDGIASSFMDSIRKEVNSIASENVIDNKTFKADQNPGVQTYNREVEPLDFNHEHPISSKGEILPFIWGYIFNEDMDNQDLLIPSNVCTAEKDSEHLVNFSSTAPFALRLPYSDKQETSLLHKTGKEDIGQYSESVDDYCTENNADTSNPSAINARLVEPEPQFGNEIPFLIKIPIKQRKLIVGNHKINQSKNRDAIETCPNNCRLWTNDVLERRVDNSSIDSKRIKTSSPLREMTSQKCRQKNEPWTPVEDAILFHSYYFAGGQKWMFILKHLRGRTETGVKNRFHHIRRRLESASVKLVAIGYTVDAELKQAIFKTAKKFEVPWDLLIYIVDLLMHTLKEDIAMISMHYSFPFDLVDVPTNDSSVVCTRCGLIVPSLHTGEQQCSKTGWCKVCCETPAYLFGNILRMHRHLVSRNQASTIDTFDTYE